MSTFANSEDPDEMQHNAAFHQGLHCLQRSMLHFIRVFLFREHTKFCYFIVW